MKKNYLNLLIITFVLFSIINVTYSQNSIKLIQSGNQDRCASQFIEQKMRGFMPNYDQIRADIEQDIINYSIYQAGNKTTYNIPVVVHVMHLGEAVGSGTNISDQQILSAINSINTAFADNNININFCIAQQTPTGAPSSGINRVLATGVNQYSTKGLCMGMSGTDNESAVKALSNWNNTKYYNIWIVSEIENNNGQDGIQGFAYFPGAPNGTDGAVMLYNAFGYDPGTGNSPGFNLKDYTDLNATFIHEMGHALNLYHSFEGDGTGSTCPVGNGCGSDVGDCCSDTPPHKRSNSDCVVGNNTCDGGTSTNLYIHNYMDYSSESCQTSFTAQQKTRMEAVMTGTRASLTTSPGCNPSNNTYDASIANIIEPISSYCQTTFSPKVSLKNFGTQTLTSVTINYNIDGGANQTYNWNGSLASGASVTVTLNSITTSNGNHTFSANTSMPNGNNDQYSSNDANSISFTILGSNSLPFVEGFESTTFPPTGWNRTSEDTSPATWGSDGVKQWERKTTGGNGSSTASAGINLYNYNTNLGSLDVLTTPFINLSGAVNPIFTFKVSNKNYPNQTDYLKVYISDDCGVNYTNVYNKSGSQLATNGSSTSTFNPSVSNDWRTETIDISSYAGKVISVKFESTNGYGNNLFIDDINIDSDCTAPTISTQPNNASICVNNNTSFTFTHPGIVTYQWQVNTGSGFTNISNGGVYSGATTATLTLSSVNSSYSGYLYRCVITNSCGNATTNSATLTVSSAPSAPSITASGNTTFCQGGSVTLTSSSSSGNTWSNGSTSNSINVTTSGTYTATVSQNGCTSPSSNQIVVTVNSNPSTPTISASGPTSFCQGGSVTLTSSSSSGNTWSNGSTSNSINVTTSGTYSVTVTQNGCTSSVSNQINVTSSPMPNAPSISASGTTTFCQGGSVTLTSSSNSGNTWSNGSNANSINVTSSGSYTATVTQNGCTSPSSSQIIITVNPLPNVSISNIADVCDTASTFVLNQGSPNGGSYTVNGITSTNFNPSSSGVGTYTVIYTYFDNNNCSNTAQTSFFVKNCNNSGLDEETYNIVLYPNPNKGLISILGVDKEQIDEVKIYDAIGRIVYNNKKTNNIQINNLSDGFYRVSVLINGNESIIPIQLIK